MADKASVTNPVSFSTFEKEVIYLNADCLFPSTDDAWSTDFFQLFSFYLHGGPLRNWHCDCLQECWTQEISWLPGIFATWAEGAYLCFFTMAFVSISWEGQWKPILEFGCPQKRISLLHMASWCNHLVYNLVDLGEDLVKRGGKTCPNTFLTTMLLLISNKLPTGMESIYKTTEKMFNLQ